MLVTEIISMISEKYGTYENQGKQLFAKVAEWITEGLNQIELKIHSTAIILSYLHTELRQLDYEEKEALKAQKVREGVIKR